MPKKVDGIYREGEVQDFYDPLTLSYLNMGIWGYQRLGVVYLFPIIGIWE